MVKVEFLGPIDVETTEFDVSSVKELKDKLYKIDGLSDWLVTCAVAVNDEIITDINTPLKDGDKVTLLPPVCGG